METCTGDETVRDKLIAFNNNLSKLNIADLSPECIEIFGKLITFCSSNQICSPTFDQMLETDVVLKTTCENLSRLFADYGHYREIRSARICAIDGNQNVHVHFNQYKNYQKMIECEVDMLRELGVHFNENRIANDGTNLYVNKIAFIGSGPIPTSTLIIANDHAPYADIYNIDISEEANQLASTLSQQLLPSDLSKHMHFITQDITAKPLPVSVKSILNQCQLIYLAAYVGMNELEKLNILENILNHSNDPKSRQYFIIRSGDDLWQLLFPKISTEKIATLSTTTDNVNQDTNRKFLFQIKAARRTLETVGIISIIAANI